MPIDRPELDCDVVMKGGITSGVVYPPAVCRLAGTYRFHNVGGTSAGAIAAASTAAAELARQTSEWDDADLDEPAPDDASSGFERLATLGEFLGTGTHLFDLFQPDRVTRPYWRLVRVVSHSRPRIAAALVGVALRLRGARRWLVLGALPGLAVLVPPVAGLSGAWSWLWGPVLVLAALAAVVVVVAGLVVGAAVATARRGVHDLAANRFGLCSGGPPAGTEPGPTSGARLTPGPEAPLTVWLSSELDGIADVAGMRRITTRRDLEQLGVVSPDGTPDGVATVDDVRALDVEVGGRAGAVVRAADLAAAGIDVSALPAKPLTFGDLAAGGVNLRMITTDLTQGRPYAVPFEPAWSVDASGYFFDPAVMRTYFPAYVVEWMEARPPSRPPGADDATWRQWELLCELVAPLRPLPDASDLPVVVATRLSLSFPVLISAVPLHAVDWSLEANRDARDAWRDWLAGAGADWRERLDDVRGWLADDDPRGWLRSRTCWLSDGGIASNFPIHFFDRPLPRWPTFGFNLRAPHPDHPMDADDERRNVWLPETAVAGHHLQWRDVVGLGRFLRLVADTMQNWGDRTQMRVHGYWDRVVHVSLDDDEGGLNLDMPPGLIRRLGARGEHAADRLADRFGVRGPGVDAAPGWDAHRWLRFRSSMALVEQLLGRLRAGYHGEPQGASRRYEELLVRGPDLPPLDYPLTAHQRETVPTATARLLELADEWRGGAAPLFGEGAPTPSPELRISPPL